MGSHELVWHATAAAHILEAQKRKGRVGGRKSRSGCLTCKQRRIKCDETLPSCRNCMSSKRKCGGYVSNPSPRPKSTGKNNTLIGIQLSHALGLRESDRRSFDFFLSWASPRLGGTFDRGFWCGEVLQVAQSEPVILDSLLAIAELYESPQCLNTFHSETVQAELPIDSVGASAYGTGRPEAYTESERELVAEAVGGRQMLALNHYNRALRGLMGQVASGKATLLIALLSCVLFICVELLRDNVYAALNLYTKGFEILRQIDPSSAHAETSLFISLKLTMTRLGILAAMYGHQDLLEGRSMIGEISETAHLRSTSDARTALYVIMADSLAFHRAAIPWKRLLLAQAKDHPDSIEASQRCGDPNKVCLAVPATGSNGIFTAGARIAQSEIKTAALPSEEYVPEQLLQQRAYFESRLNHWRSAMERIEGKDDESVSNLMMYYHASMALKASRLSLFESVHDDYTHHYREIVRFAGIYYKCKVEQPSFTFEPGAVPILWMVVTKCRIPFLRREALALIRKAPKKECMWGRDSVAEFGVRVIAIEEELLWPSTCSTDSRSSSSPSLPDILPPESSRIHELEILQNPGGNDSSIRIIRYLQDTDGSRMKLVQDYPI